MTGVGVPGMPGWFDPHDERTARAAWSRLAEPGDRGAGRVLERLGPGRALQLLVESPAQVTAAAAGPRGGADPGQEWRPDRASVAGWRVRLGQLDPVRDLATVRRFGGRLVIPGDQEWPVVLERLGERTPFALWVRGPLELARACERSVALVGCRACTRYGEHVATELGAGCAHRGITVVSGAAYGIDACAHRGALSVGGSTVAVLACGVDRSYPQGNAALIERIVAQGAVVSEVPPGSSPTRWRFVQRNRVIAALSPVTVVVEAAWRSGSSITAREAVDLGHDLAAVPGPVTSSASAGCHRLLRDGATCVTDAAEIAELLAPIGQQLALLAEVAVAEHDGLGPVDLRVLDALPLRAGVPVASVTAAAGIDRSSVTAALGRLELLGLAASAGDGWCRAKPPAKPSVKPPAGWPGRSVQPRERPVR
jgi:DNA processing protein